MAGRNMCDVLIGNTPPLVTHLLWPLARPLPWQHKSLGKVDHGKQSALHPHLLLRRHSRLCDRFWWQKVPQSKVAAYRKTRKTRKKQRRQQAAAPIQQPLS
jgi:hypothetical protein